MSEEAGGNRMASGWLGRWEEGWRAGGLEGYTMNTICGRGRLGWGQGRKVVATLEVVV